MLVFSSGSGQPAEKKWTVIKGLLGKGFNNVAFASGGGGRKKGSGDIFGQGDCNEKT